MAEYLVTPDRGRVGKARQVKPFVVKYDGLPGDLDKLKIAHTNGLRAHSHKRLRIASSVEPVPGSDYALQGVLYHLDTSDILCTTLIEPLEADNA